MKLFVTRNNINHRSITVNRGDIIEEADRNHIGALQSVGCQVYDPDKHDAIIERIAVPPKPEQPKISTPEPEATPEPEPEPAKKAPSKKAAKKRTKN